MRPKKNKEFDFGDYLCVFSIIIAFLGTSWVVIKLINFYG